MNHLISRRELITLMSAGALGAALVARRAVAGDAQRLDVKEPAAVALSYVEHASQVDAKRHPEFIAGSNCANCLKLEGKSGDAYRPCSLFPGKLVAVDGWCSGWTAEM